ncbi:MAG: PAS domain S-box protein [Candidatus Kapabacteria bacterium]|nr:PAS domain S-box protein [Candidatus Kapabacteria bacterium]
MDQQQNSKTESLDLRTQAEKILHDKRRATPLPSTVAELQQLVTDLELRSIESDLLQKKEQSRHKNYSQYQALLLNSVGQAVIATDRNGYITFWNSAAEKLYGWSTEEALGRDIMDTIALEQSKEQGAEIIASLARGESWSGEDVVRHRNGSAIPIHVYDTPVLDESGALIGIIGVAHDISAQKLAEEQLRRMNKALADFQNAIQQVSIVSKTDKQGVITYFNDKFVAISGYSSYELIGQKHNIINSGHHPRQFWVDMWKTIASGKQWHAEVKNRAKDGTYYWVDTFIIPLLDERGGVLEFLSVRNDITQRKYIEHELETQHRFMVSLTTNLPSLISYWTPDLQCAFANTAVRNMFDKSPSEMNNITPQKLLGETLYEQNKPFILSALEGKRQQFERRITKQNGDVADLWIDYVPDISEGHLAGITVVIQDITEIKKAQFNLNQAQHIAHIGSWEWDLVKNEINWSDELYAIFGEDKDSYQPTLESYLTYLSAEVAQKVDAMLQTALKGEGLFAMEHEITRADGVKRYVFEQAVITFDNEMRPIKMQGTTQDITERKLVEEQLLLSEQRYRSFVELQGTYFVRTDLEGKYTYASPSMLNDFSSNQASLIGRHGFEHIIPEDFEVARITVEQCLQAPGTPFRVMLRKPHVSGAIYWTDWEFIAITNSRGVVSEIQCVGYNITDRIKAENQLSRSEANLRAIMDSSIQAFWLIDKALRVQAFNKASAQIVQDTFAREIAVGDSILDYVRPERQERFMESTQSALNGEVIIYEEHFQIPSVGEQWVELMYLPTYQSDGSIIGVTISTVNITERKLAYQELEKMNTTLEERVARRTQELLLLNKEKDEFLGIAAHDLKNPLAGILSSAELLERYFPNEKTHRFTSMIINASNQMLDIITNLLDVNRIETGMLSLHFEPVNLEILDTIVEEYQSRATEKGIIVHYEAPERDTAWVHGDKQCLRQIFDNLISNAIKYSPHWKNVWIRVLSNTSGNVRTIRVEIQDEGQGLSEQDKKKLFGKFARLSAQPTGGENSTGLGLSIVKKLVEMHNGRVWCESEADKGVPGATFIVEMPSVETTTL